jgi:hypothetical protein
MPGPYLTSRFRRRRRDLLIGVSFGLLITAGVTSYLLTGGLGDGAPSEVPRGRSASFPVTLTVKPPWAKVTLDGQELGKADEGGRLRVNLPSDSLSMNWLEVSAIGFHSVRRPVSVYSGVNEVTVELIQKPYDVAIRTQPPDAEVWINDELKGHTPLTFTFPPGEKVQLAVKLPGYDPVTRELTPSRDSERVDLDLTLRPSAALARVESDPPGAHVRVNGQIKGITPVDVRIDPAWRGKSITLSASLAGYEDAEATLVIPQAQAEAIPRTAIKLAALRSSGEIASKGRGIVIDAPAGREAPMVTESPEIQPGTTRDAEAGSAVVLALVSSSSAGADHYALLREINGQIHRLGGDHRFAVVSAGPEGARVWPALRETAPATSDQKIRAYDAVRALRPADSGNVTSAVDAALALRPSAVWLYSTTDVSADLERLAVAAAGRRVNFHIVTTADVADESRLASWTAQYQGTYTLLGRRRMAFDAASSE